jgi:hypothetical protein
VISTVLPARGDVPFAFRERAIAVLQVSWAGGRPSC